MKRCRTCNRTYTDPNLTYCIEDGTPLTTEAPQEELYRPPSAYVPPGTMPGAVTGKRERRAWPWIVGILGAFILGAIVLMIAAVILVPRMMRPRQENVPVVATSEEPDQPDQPEGVDSPAPTDEAQVLAQLTDVENDWTVANLNADKKKLDRILADDYVGPRSPDDTDLQDKKEYLATVQRETRVERWEFADLKVDLLGDRATLTGKLTFFGQGGAQESFDFTDKFVWRNGRWQATGSEVHRIQ